MPARLKSHREIRHDRRRRAERQPMDRTFRAFDSGAGGLTVREPENGNDDSGTEEKRPGDSGRYDAVRKGETGHRPDIQIEWAARSDPLSGRRPRPGESRNNGRVRFEL